MLTCSGGSVVYMYQEDAASVQEALLIVQPDIDVPPKYASNLYRIYFVETESVTATLEGQRIFIEPGQLLTLSPDEQIEFDDKSCVRSLGFHHNFFCVKVKRTEVYCDGVVFNTVSASPIVTLPEKEWPLLRHRFEELHEIMLSQSPFVEERAISTLRSILLQAADCKLRSRADSAVQAEIEKGVSDLVLHFQDLLDRHYVDKRDIIFYSDALNVTSSKLNRHLKAELGQTALQMINERVAIAARAELRSGQKSIKQVAIGLGFDDPLYFSRFFKKYFGSAPSHYFSLQGVEEELEKR